MVDEEKLDRYLKKCELQYRACHQDPGYAGTLDWLTPYCGTVRRLRFFLRRLGFRIAEIVDERTLARGAASLGNHNFRGHCLCRNRWNVRESQQDT